MNAQNIQPVAARIVVSNHTPESPFVEQTWSNSAEFFFIQNKHYCYGKADAISYEDKDSIVEGYENPANADDITIPIFVYMHSGTAFSVSPFGCRWDSGMVGYVRWTMKNAIKDFGPRENMYEFLFNHMATVTKEATAWANGELYLIKYYGQDGKVMRDFSDDELFYGRCEAEAYLKDRYPNIIVMED